MERKLTIYRKDIKRYKERYAYFFIKNELQNDFAHLKVFTLECDDGKKYPNVSITISGNYKNPRYFIFINEFFKDHSELTSSDRISSIDYRIENNVVKLYIKGNPPKQTTRSIESSINESGKQIKSAHNKQVEYDESFKNKIITLLGENEEQGLNNTFKENEWYFRATEANVRAELIDPILKTIGWSVPYLRREDHARDYVLCREKYAGKGSTQLIIEAKKYREQLLETEKEDDTFTHEQLKDYLTRAEIPFGILTNGIRWCLFNKDRYQGEIDIRKIKTDTDSICKFFKLISYELIKDKNNQLNDFDLGFLHRNDISRKECAPTTIYIEDHLHPEKSKSYKSGEHCEANYQIAEIVLEKKPIELFGMEFFRDIVFKKSDKDYPIKASRTNKQYEKDKSLFLIGDYVIYDKITLLQEINSTLDLGLSISVE